MSGMGPSIPYPGYHLNPIRLIFMLIGWLIQGLNHRIRLNHVVLIQILIRHPRFLIPGCNTWLIQGLIHGQTLILGLIQTSMTKGVQLIGISGLINTNCHAQKIQWVFLHHHSHQHKTWNQNCKKSPLPPTILHDNQNPFARY